MDPAYPFFATRGARPLFPPERGALTIQGGLFWTAEGTPWLWRGESMFLLLERLMAGEDITPQLQWMRATGANVARVFVAGVDWPGHANPVVHPQWTSALQRLADRHADAGLRLHATVGTYQLDDVAYWHPIVQTVFDTLQGRWNCTVEYGNEPHKNGLGILDETFDTHGLIYSTGADPTHKDPIDKAGPFGEAHYARDPEHFPRNSKDNLELRSETGKPWISGEIIGIGEREVVGGGARTTDRDGLATHFGIAALFGAGGTRHSQYGLEARVPSRIAEPTSRRIAQAIADVWAFIPPRAQLGAYAAPHVGNFPVACAGGSCSRLEHAYASILGNEAWLVVPKPVPGWTAAGQEVQGWRVVAQCTDLPVWRLVR